MAFCAVLSPHLITSNLRFWESSANIQENPTSSIVQHGANSDEGNLMSLLTTLAKKQGLADDEFLAKTRFTINQQRRTFSYDLAAIPLNFILSETDPLARPLEVLVRIEVLRRDFYSAIPDERFWRVSLDSIEHIVSGCVQDAKRSEVNGAGSANHQDCYTNVDPAFEKLGTQILSYASIHGLEQVEPPRPRDPVVGYRVYIKVEPPRARVRVMPLLEYKKYKFQQVPEEIYQWTDLLDPESRMIGWYHYRVEWPTELNGPEEGDFEIKKPGTITFRPPQR